MKPGSKRSNPDDRRNSLRWALVWSVITFTPKELPAQEPPDEDIVQKECIGGSMVDATECAALKAVESVVTLRQTEAKIRATLLQVDQPLPQVRKLVSQFDSAAWWFECYRYEHCYVISWPYPMLTNFVHHSCQVELNFRRVAQLEASIAPVPIFQGDAAAKQLRDQELSDIAGRQLTWYRHQPCIMKGRWHEWIVID